jgi:hypothetical protein
MLFASDWYAIYDTQTGGYLPGNAVMEGHILPAYAQQIAPYRIESIVARTPNTRVNDPMAQSFGMQMPRDSGSMTFTVRTPQGELLWGEAFAETLRTADDTMGIGLGVYTVPLCSIVVSPADQSTLSQAGATLRQMRNSMQLDGRNSQAWLQASRSASQASHSANMAAINGARERSQMTFQTYNEISDMQMDSWQRMQESGDRLQQIQTNTIRGGEYMTNPETGQEYWTTHEVDNWYVNSGGAVVGTEIQEVPTYDDSWTQLESQVPEPSY